MSGVSAQFHWKYKETSDTVLAFKELIVRGQADNVHIGWEEMLQRLEQRGESYKSIRVNIKKMKMNKDREGKTHWTKAGELFQTHWRKPAWGCDCVSLHEEAFMSR